MTYQSKFSSFAPTTTGKIGALSEVLAVFFLGSAIATIFFQLAGIKGHPLMAIMADNPDMFSISGEMAKILLLQYAGWFILVVLFGWGFNRRFIKELGASRGYSQTKKQAYPLLWLIGLGVVGWSIGDLPNKIVWILDAEFDLGTSVPWREALLNAEKTAGWWTLMAVGSFGLIPFIEEIFWRGYVQARLQNSYSPAVAIIASASMFTLSHSQYHMADAYHLATIGAVFFGSLVFGWMFYKTGSLIPAIVMHALLNFPADGIWAYLAVALMSIIVTWKWTQIKAELVEFKQRIRKNRWNFVDFLVIGLLSASMLCLSQFPYIVSYVGYTAGAMFAGILVYYRFFFEQRTMKQSIDCA